MVKFRGLGSWSGLGLGLGSGLGIGIGMTGNLNSYDNTV